ncbi:hypothetical protein EIN_081980 [Entamoeba invadens IP1]|uniref:hypothetical protein n=1 Tax=Entamoeba invadens IP1 TaxID=370355 RepID=UPI0002C3E7C2|nr:hypothetical protein EIN_081980 [Entamoeba invadens IP1]ELP85156.1 hypothetical protein EIN_081980 [Entamoeba invadens IP1]|eukprot:XP_004184502.1 hypothetical protein EIN_081980 [Entamoeba invadens IP1]
MEKVGQSPEHRKFQAKRFAVPPPVKQKPTKEPRPQTQPETQPFIPYKYSETFLKRKAVFEADDPSAQVTTSLYRNTMKFTIIDEYNEEGEINVATVISHKQTTLPKIGERRILSTDVVLTSRNDTVSFVETKGKFIMTNYKIEFQAELDFFSFYVPLIKIANFKKINTNERVRKRLFYIETKDNQCFTFSFDDNQRLRRAVNKELLNRVYTTSPEMLFIFCSPSFKKTKAFYNFQREFERQGVFQVWDVYSGNSRYAMSSTYPALVYVPKTATDAMIKSAINYRSKGRFPVLTWFNDKMGSALLRSSQPLPGLITSVTTKQIPGDMDYLCKVDEVTGRKLLHVLDSRPLLNAMTNKAAGGGYEDENTYPFLKVDFENIPNIHIVRETWRQLYLSVYGISTKFIDENFIKTKEVVRWFQLQEAVLNSSEKTSKLIESGTSVLVHCSDGWDRTAQCCGIAEIILDGYYRTLEGFIVLVEKDWKSFGHRFMTRTGFAVECPFGQYSPIFFQFLDCVHILMNTFTHKFEFNEDFLVELNEAIFSAAFGTFMFDTEKERVETKVEEKTPCFWEYVFQNRTKFVNITYDGQMGKLDLETTQPKMVIWEKYFLRNKVVVPKKDENSEIEKHDKKPSGG